MKTSIDVVTMDRISFKNIEKERVVVDSATEKAIQEFPDLAAHAGFKPSSYELVLLKPNVCGMYPPNTELLKAVIRYLIPYSKTLIIGETPSAMHKPIKRFKSLGITDLARSLNVAIRDLMEDEVTMKKVPSPHVMKKIPLPTSILEADLLVNCPGLGTHRSTLLTCALKNLFGLIAEKYKFFKLHPKGVSEVVADLFQIVKPELNVVDCGKRTLVGTDALSVDVVACEYKALSPYRVKHLVLAARDLGLDLKDLRIRHVKL